MADLVNHPKHYTFGSLEVIDVLSDWFTFCPLLWMVGKYLSRLGKKDPYLQDLQKAEWYLKRYEAQEYSKRALPPPTLSLETVLASWDEYLDSFQIEAFIRLQEYFKPAEKRDPSKSLLALMKDRIEALSDEKKLNFVK